MELVDILKTVELFSGLQREDLQKVAGLCQPRQFQAGEIITRQGEMGDELFLITQGMVEVSVNERQSVVNLGEGQIFGEMALLDQGARSATVTAGNQPTIVQIIPRADFYALCAQNKDIGFIVMRNLAHDLSFKLRHRNLSREGKP
ncbi:MAG: cyclic nucleotide-binding domain-containing protein [Chloroflexi bacterium]|nr:cyclic nucleotide-binding domain-containing protein [Chloroflexota bacterium]